MPVPSLAEAFRLTLDLAAELPVGRLATGGVRTVRSAQSGTIKGRGLAAKIVTGAETWLTRMDGVSGVELSLVAQPVGQAPIRMTGMGISSADSGGALRMNIVFEVAEGAEHEWLATRVFIAERSEGDDTLVIFEVL